MLTNYSKTLTLLQQYNKGKPRLIKKAKGKSILEYDKTRQIIVKIRKDLIIKKEAGNLFGQESGDKFRAVLENIYQIYNF